MKSLFTLLATVALLLSCTSKTSTKPMSEEIYKGKFGSCCKDLKDAMDTTIVHNSFFRVEENGVLYQTVGYVDTQNGPGFFDQAVIYCPFCGKPLQDKDEIKKKAGH